MQSEISKAFDNPSNEYRGKPFWSWNGELEKEELFRQIHVMRDMGFGGYFMHSRTGLATEYMGKEWFELINACADEGQRFGLESWLYDEDRWPSGTAGGMVTKEPKFRQKLLRLTPTPENEFVWNSEMVAAFACVLDGLDYRDCVRLEPQSPRDAFAGKTVLVFTTEEQAKQSFYNGFTYLDTLNREATDRFIELTHDKYARECGDRLGGTIKGIFTDEPHRGQLMDGFGARNPDSHWAVPYTYTLFADFQKRFGYDLVERLPELFLHPQGRKVSQVKWHFVELLMQLFIENWAKPCDDWCRRNNLILTGHVLHEDSLTAQTSMCGSMMRYYEHMEYPGVDVLCEHNYNFWIVKQLASAARQLGQKWLLSELYGCTGWQMPFEGHKAVGDWQALFGINLRCPHLSWYTMEGEAKRDFPASILHQSAWYGDYDFVETYFARMGVMMSAGKACCDLLVMNPVESVWCQVYPGWARFLGATGPEAQALEKTYQETFHALAGAQLDFDYGDEEMTPRLGSVEKSAVPVLRVGQAAYKAVVISGMLTIRATVLDLLESFVDAGGVVIMAGDPPTYVDAQPSERARAFAARCVRVPAAGPELAAACEKAVGRRASAVDAGGAPVKDIFCQVRQDDGAWYALFLNVNRKDSHEGVRIRFNAAGYVQEWDCTTGAKFRVPAVNTAGVLEFTADFAPSGEHLYVVTSTEDASLPIRQSLTETRKVTVSGPFKYELSESNLCVLDYAEWRLDDSEWKPAVEILKADRAIRTQLGLELRGGEMLQPWFLKLRGFEVAAQLKLRFSFNVEAIPDGPLHLVMEQPSHFTITLNGQAVNGAGDEGWWADPCFRKLPIAPAMLKMGKNTVELAVGFHEGINLECLYLLGQFGVSVNGTASTLTAMPVVLKAGDIAPQGFPFYTGGVTYLLDSPATPADVEKVFVALPEFGAACVKVPGNDGKQQVIGWQPYEADVTTVVKAGGPLRVEAVLTRRNAFGPLHQLPKVSSGYGPGNFITDGAHWTDEYQLYPSGLIQAPVFSYRA